MIDILIPLGSNSSWQDNELRYTLRSIEKHAKNYRDIFIIGDIPNWITNVIHIAAKDEFQKERNICEKILKGCNDKRMTSDFFFTNDDITLLKDIDCSRYPYYYKGSLYQTIQRIHPDLNYKQSLENTFTALIMADYSQYHFDMHCPIIYNKECFINAMEQYDWEIDYGYVIKSLYANTVGIKGQHNNDLKINLAYSREELDHKLKGRDVFSYADGAITSTFKIMLHELFPKPSKYEKW